MKNRKAFTAAALLLSPVPAVHAQQNVQVAANITDAQMQRDCAIYAVNATGEKADIATLSSPGKSAVIHTTDYKNNVTSSILLTYTDKIERNENGSYQLGDLILQFNYAGQPAITFQNGAFIVDQNLPSLNNQSVKDQMAATAQKVWGIQGQCLSEGVKERRLARMKLGLAPVNP